MAPALLRHRRAWVAIVAGCAAVATVSLAVPATLGYDPWAWLIWGREVGRWSLDTTGGPSWKPLPVAVTAVLAPLDDLAVPLYTIVARTAALVAVVVVVSLAGRLGGRWAGVVAGAAVLLTPDGDPRFIRLVLEAHEAPWSMGLAIAALATHLARRHGRTMLLLWLLSLLRPEAWPFLLVHVVWTWGWRLSTPSRSRRSARWWSPATRRDRSIPAGWGIAALASIPVLWFGMDWVGSGSFFNGAEAAQVLAGRSIPGRLADSLGSFATSVPVAVWLLAAVPVGGALRRDRRALAQPAVVLAASALAWSLLVVGMAVIGGYAAIGRFFLPAAAVVCVLAGVGAVEVASVLRRRLGDESSTNRPPVTRRAIVAGVVIGVLAIASLVPRVVGIADVLDEVAARGRLQDDLDATIAAAGGGDVLARCGGAVVSVGTLLRASVPWTLDLPLSLVERPEPGQPAVLVLASPRAVEEARAAPTAVELADGEYWTVFADRCPDVVG